jgi:hypothetical protein
VLVLKKPKNIRPKRGRVTADRSRIFGDPRTGTACACLCRRCLSELCCRLCIFYSFRDLYISVNALDRYCLFPLHCRYRRLTCDTQPLFSSKTTLQVGSLPSAPILSRQTPSPLCKHPLSTTSPICTQTAALCSPPTRVQSHSPRQLAPQRQAEPWLSLLHQFDDVPARTRGREYPKSLPNLVRLTLGLETLPDRM